MINGKQVSFVLVNYKNFKVTIDCVNSLLKNEPNSSIVVVENFSQNNSFEMLKKEFDSFNQVNVINTKKNVGYANALNIGIHFSRTVLKSDFVVISNSDILYQDYLGVEKTIETGYKNGVGVISMSMLNDDLSFQNPYGCYNHSPLLTFMRTLLFVTRESFRTLRKKGGQSTVISGSFSDYFNRFRYIVNTASGVLTPDFFKHYSFLHPKTFIYLEEACLYFYLRKAKLKASFTNCCQVIHLEKQSTDNPDYYRKKIKRLRKAMWVLFPLLFKNEKRISKSNLKEVNRKILPNADYL